MTATNHGPARVDFHHHLLPTGELAEWVRGSLGDGSGPRRFSFFAYLPTPTDVDAALEEFAYARFLWTRDPT